MILISQKLVVLGSFQLVCLIGTDSAVEITVVFRVIMIWPLISGISHEAYPFMQFILYFPVDESQIYLKVRSLQIHPINQM